MKTNMIKLKDLNKNIKSLQGNTLLDLSGKASLTRKKALVSICEMHQPKNPGQGEAIQAFDLGSRIQKSKKSLEISEEDLNFLTKILSESQIFLSVIIGRLNEYLEKAKERSEKKKSKKEESD